MSDKYFLPQPKTPRVKKEPKTLQAKTPLKKSDKPINKKSKNKEEVTTETYNKVLERDKKCRLCGTSNWLELHHIVYRSQDKTKINDIRNCIILCLNCHRLVHTNKKKYKPILFKLVESDQIGELI